LLWNRALSLIIFKIIPHPIPLLTAFPLHVIIPYLILYHLFLLPYYYTCPWCIPGFVWCLDYHCSHCIYLTTPVLH
jgi:hypothetical protein